MAERKSGLRERITALLLAVILPAAGALAGVGSAGLLTAKPVEAASATKVVVLDPGHGGSEKGACYYGMEEKTLNLRIAKYCQAQLNQYSGVRVILTRTTDRKFNTSDLSADLQARCRVAKNNQADLFVCLHNNAYGAGESKKTNGARVYHQNESFSKAVGDKSRRLAQLIVDRVAACGLANGGARVKYSEDRSRRDPNGKKGDFYGVLFYCKQYRIPAVIVEHAFMSNPGDASKLKKESFLKKLGQADAAAIASYLGLKKKTAPSAKTGWQTSSGSRYYFGSNGEKVTGLQSIDGKTYYFRASDGKMMTGWYTFGGKRYFFSRVYGHMLKGLFQIDSRKYYLSPSDGHMLTGWQTIEKKKYYFKPKSGQMLTGWQTIGGKKYFLSRTDGHMLTGTHTIDGKKYRFSSDGVLKKTY